MERFLLKKLLAWKTSPYRKPLIVKGVRQVGKTWILKEFGRLYYDNVAYFNFDENEEYKQFFDTTKNVNRILQNLSMASSQTISPKKTLIIFDEVQDCPNVINSMKYFCENAPEYHIACAGSLLGIALAKPSSFPVGKVNFMQVDPMTFEEFLIANGDSNLAEYIQTIDTIEPIPDAFFNPLYEKLKMYYVTGGMPEPVRIWTEARDVNVMQEALSNIIEAYERDFAKHPNVNEFPKISMIWNSIPSQLAKENKKFLYKVVKTGARAREYEDALQWLIDARLVHKIYRSTSPGLPISAYDDVSAFKIYLVDVGLLRRLAKLAPTAFGEGNRLFTEFKGALTENFVLQTLMTQFEVTPRYWSQANPPYEVDFLIQRDNDIFPIEVKSESNTTSKSLKKFKELFPDKVKLRIRYSLDNLKLDDDVLNIPLFMAGQTDHLIELALKEKSV
ncbi:MULTISPECIES: ATP-binding protein [Faecalicoccus]|uniref:ATP-binding protein n=1 Tax=Faecalicoccus pleomorphus TaxID=1323 RepID=A0AAW6CR46_9FIRM|nr:MULTISPECIES: ATP-binding protein [Faecalicoccus]MDB7979947.1 ATP-binding protein [Faecalicoccus pleomorphus]MDB7982267.1 ATP-binding protein [Faecalicoccus pleomorphus]